MREQVLNLKASCASIRHCAKLAPGAFLFNQKKNNNLYDRKLSVSLQENLLFSIIHLNSKQHSRGKSYNTSSQHSEDTLPKGKYTINFYCARSITSKRPNETYSQNTVKLLEKDVSDISIMCMMVSVFYSCGFQLWWSLTLNSIVGETYSQSLVFRRHLIHWDVVLYRNSWYNWTYFFHELLSFYLSFYLS